MSRVLPQQLIPSFPIRLGMKQIANEELVGRLTTVKLQIQRSLELIDFEDVSEAERLLAIADRELMLLLIELDGKRLRPPNDLG